MNDAEEKNKKRKVTLSYKRNGVIDYSVIKLPAPLLAFYLENDCQSFIRDCLRYSFSSFLIKTNIVLLLIFLHFFSLKQQQKDSLSTSDASKVI